MTYHSPLTVPEFWQYVGSILPELILVLAVCAVVLADMLVSLRQSRLVCGGMAFGGVALALVVALMTFGTASGDAWRGMLRTDTVAHVFRILILIGTGASVLFSMRSVETGGYRQGEYFALLLGAAAAACVLAASGNFIVFVLALETLSLCSYMLAAYVKHERLSAEAGLKYLLYGAVASGVMVFGLGYVYGMSGTLAIEPAMARVAALYADRGETLVVLLTMLLVLAGLGFKIAMVPFHFWCPDVYQGAPTPVTAFLAVVSKSAGFAALLRLFMPMFEAGITTQPGGVLGGASIVLGVLAMITMTFGNLTALKQTDAKRLLAYSSIAHAGYLLMGLSIFSEAGAHAVIFYLIMYLVMTLGAFWIVIVLINRVGSAQIARFNGTMTNSPLLFICMFIFLISLTGLPPTAGFVGKFRLFEVVIQAGGNAVVDGALTPAAIFYFVLALVAALNTAVSLYYYMRIIASMMRPADDGAIVPVGAGALDNFYAVVLAVCTILLINFGPIARVI